MTHRVPAFVTAALFTLSVASVGNIAAAAPIADPLAIKNSAPTNVESVWWRRGGWGWGVGAGLLGAAIVGGAIASAPYYYGAPGPYYYGPPPAYYYPEGPGGDAVGYCMRRFRSYDPGSGTYLGTDGLRHPCP